MAHALYGHDGPCRNIHGHTYHLHVTILGPVVQDEKSPKNGMVIDFSDLKQMIKEKIIDQFDHTLVLYYKDAEKIKPKPDSPFGKLLVTSWQPSCENLVLHFKKIIAAQLHKKLTLVALLLRETPSSFAEWRIEDN
jgi:6-pyruvoyltetrahydropterin/6-carboxytetrahydropterin synthase